MTQKKFCTISPLGKALSLLGFLGMPLRSSGFRLAYEVKDEEIVVLVLKVGKRDKFYETLQNYL